MFAANQDNATYLSHMITSPIPLSPMTKKGLLQQNRIKTGLLSFKKSGIELLPKNWTKEEALMRLFAGGATTPLVVKI